MIATCRCGKNFLTESDPYVTIPLNDYELNCGCFYSKKESSPSLPKDKLRQLDNRGKYDGYSSLGELIKVKRSTVLVNKKLVAKNFALRKENSKLYSLLRRNKLYQMDQPIKEVSNGN